FLPLRKYRRREGIPTVDDAVGANPQAGKLAAPGRKSVSRPNSTAIPGVDGSHGADGRSAAFGRPIVEHAAPRRGQGTFRKTSGRRAEHGLRRSHANAIPAGRRRLCPRAGGPFRAISPRYPARRTIGLE